MPRTRASSAALRSTARTATSTSPPPRRCARRPRGISRGEDDLLLVAVEARDLGDGLRYEPSRGGELFPHLYAPLPLSAVRWVKPLPLGPDGQHAFPRVSARAVIASLFPLARPLLHALDPETAHQLTIRVPVAHAGAAAAAGRRPASRSRPSAGAFPNPVGLAAGFDKQCEVPDQLLGLGFGFVEVRRRGAAAAAGQSRARASSGSPRDGAIINRFGLNSDGLEAARARLARRRGRPRHRRGQYRRQQGCGRPHRRLRGLRRGALRASSTS